LKANPPSNLYAYGQALVKEAETYCPEYFNKTALQANSLE